MNYNNWRKYYKQILNDFGFDEAKDNRAAQVLSALLKTRNTLTPEELKKAINDKNVYVLGLAESLPKYFQPAIQKPVTSNSVLIAADGATSILIRKDIIPTIITTDLDGDVEDQIFANKKGAIVIVHAHGDNIDKLKRWVPRFRGRLVGTTQSKPFNRIYNFGGFTDGDRAVFLADHFGAKKIYLVGFDFSRVSKFSTGKDKAIKLKKLKWARKLIKSLGSKVVII